MTRPEIKIEDKQAFLEKTLEGLRGHDDEPDRLFQALLLACGRRPSTLHLSIEDRWEIPKGQKKGEKKILYKERLKKRGRLLPGDQGVPIPLLCPAEDFLRALRVFQRRYNGRGKVVTESNAQALHGANHRLWCEDSGLKPRDFRSIYAAYVAQDASVRGGATAPATVSRALLHSDVGASLSYLRVDLESPKT